MYPRIVKKIECITCLTRKPNKEYTLLTPPCIGEHKAEVCTDCVRKWIQLSLEGGGTRITCPQCLSELGFFTIKRLADAALFQKFETRTLHGLLEQDPAFVWCAHACGSGQSHRGGRGEPVMTCHHCGALTCVNHRIPWHSGLTCDQFDESLRLPPPGQREREQKQEQDRLQRARDDAASREVVRKDTKACPQCRFDIQKDGGCDHMTCECILMTRARGYDLLRLYRNTNRGRVTLSHERVC